jgi:hypothetical protein
MAKIALGNHAEATQPDCVRAVLAEVLLTFLFVFAGVGAAMAAGICVSLCISLSIYLTYMHGQINTNQCHSKPKKLLPTDF